jgi:hypothetical protein
MYNIYVGCLKYYKVLAIIFYYIVVAYFKRLGYLRNDSLAFTDR